MLEFSLTVFGQHGRRVQRELGIFGVIPFGQNSIKNWREKRNRKREKERLVETDRQRYRETGGHKHTDRETETEWQYDRMRVRAGNTKGKYHCTVDLLFDWF